MKRLKYKQHVLKKDQDRLITRAQACEILGVHTSRLSQLKQSRALLPIGETNSKRGHGRRSDIYSLRAVIAYALSHPVAVEQQRKGRLTHAPHLRAGLPPLKPCAVAGCPRVTRNPKYCSPRCAGRAGGVASGKVRRRRAARRSLVASLSGGDALAGRRVRRICARDGCNIYHVNLSYCSKACTKLDRKKSGKGKDNERTARA